MTRLLAVVALVAATASRADIAPRRPTPPPSECKADSECVITTFAGCCGACCPRAPYAMSAAKQQAAEDRCAVVRCGAPKCDDVACAMVMPEPASAFRAVCEAGRCVARRVGEVTECRRDADCAVVTAMPPAGAACYSSPCGCCPSTVAAPVDAPRPAPPPGTKPVKKGAAPGGPSFGLSTGDGRAPQPNLPPPRCEPCAQPPPGNAACVAGKCTLVAPKPPPPPPPPPG
ncbi:MAG: hypothetical protein AB1938_23520 [Myxococcota bacterium]